MLVAGSVILAAIALKIGGYGFLRFNLPIVPDASQEWAWLVIALSLIAVMARLRRPDGYPIAWAAQLVAVLLGFLTPAMFLMGAIFLVIWVVSFVLGRRIEADRAARA